MMMSAACLSVILIALLVDDPSPHCHRDHLLAVILIFLGILIDEVKKERAKR